MPITPGENLEATFGRTVSTGLSDGSRDDMLMRASGYHADKTITLSANNTTAQENIFQITGTIEIVKIRAEIVDATTLVNCTAVSLQLYDSTVAVQLTSAGGSVISAFPVGSMLVKIGKAATAITVTSAAAGAITESTIDKKTYDQFLVTQKTGADTFVRFQYTTIDAPINAQLEWHCEWRPINGGTLVAV